MTSTSTYINFHHTCLGFWPGSLPLLFEFQTVLRYAVEICMCVAQISYIYRHATHCEEIRGDITMISMWFAISNNPIVPGQNPSKPATHIHYRDMNNLYSGVMSQYLPTGGSNMEAVPGNDHHTTTRCKKWLCSRG